MDQLSESWRPSEWNELVKQQAAFNQQAAGAGGGGMASFSQPGVPQTWGPSGMPSGMQVEQQLQAMRSLCGSGQPLAMQAAAAAAVGGGPAASASAFPHASTSSPFAAPTSSAFTSSSAPFGGGLSGSAVPYAGASIFRDEPTAAAGFAAPHFASSAAVSVTETASGTAYRIPPQRRPVQPLAAGTMPLGGNALRVRRTLALLCAARPSVGSVHDPTVASLYFPPS